MSWELIKLPEQQWALYSHSVDNFIGFGPAEHVCAMIVEHERGSESVARRMFANACTDPASTFLFSQEGLLTVGDMPALLATFDQTTGQFDLETVQRLVRPFEVSS